MDADDEEKVTLSQADLRRIRKLEKEDGRRSGKREALHGFLARAGLPPGTTAEDLKRMLRRE